MTLDQQAVMNRVQRERGRASQRDSAYRDIQLARAGRLHEIAPGMFPPDMPKSLVSNMVDTAARDVSEPMSTLPTIMVHPDSASQRAKDRATKLTRLTNWYVQKSNLRKRMYWAADHYVTYGAVILYVEPDQKLHTPLIRVDKPIGTYWGRDQFDRLIWLAQDVNMSVDMFVDTYPEYEGFARQGARGFGGSLSDGSKLIRVCQYRDEDHMMMWLPDHKNTVIRDFATPCMSAVVIERPGDSLRGQFDDVIWVQILRSRFQTLALDATEQAIGAPIAAPPDVPDIPIGPDQIIRSQNPQLIQRIRLDVPPDVYRQEAALAQEFRDGARYPQTRSGNVHASVITGAGVDALNGSFDSQISTGHDMLAQGLKEALGLCLAMDEKMYGGLTREIQGEDAGAYYNESVQVSRDIAGAREVAVTYGMMAGLDPNRALVFGLQARGDQLISRDFLRAQMPWQINLGTEESKIDAEQIRDAIKSAIAGMAQTIPAMAAQGQDPLPIMQKLAMIIQAHQNGKTLEDAMVSTFTPKPQPAASQQPPGVAPPGMGGGDPMGGMATGGGGGDPGLGGGEAPMQNPMGMVAGGGQAQPDLQTLLAGLSNGGQANLGATIKRRIPISA